VAVTGPRTLARVELARLPTPLQEAPRLAAALGVAGRLLVKRDDLTGFAFAGNKARPLEMILADARLHDADVLVTGGAPSSNFCAAAAAAARWAGMLCVLVYAGTAEPAGPVHPNLAAARHWGAAVRWSGSSERDSVDGRLDVVAAELTGTGRTPYVVPRGAASPLGAVGFLAAAHELVDQLEATGPDVRGNVAAVIATGSGGSTAGLLAATGAQPRLRVLGAAVSRPPDETTPRIRSLAEAAAGLAGAPAPDHSRLQLIDARGPGHGLPSAEGSAAADLALQTEGLVLDPAYTAKALAALPELLGERRRDPGACTVFWHTGGLLDSVAEWL